MRTLVTTPTWGGITFSQPSGLVGVAAGGGGGGFTPADIFSNKQFNGDWSGFTNGAGADPDKITGTGFLQLATAVSSPAMPAGFPATTGFVRGWTGPSETDARNIITFAGVSRIWVRAYFYSNNDAPSQTKWIRFQSSGQNLGGLFMGNGDGNFFRLLSDVENGANPTSLQVPHASVLNGVHYVEIDYDRAGLVAGQGGFPSFAFYFDGTQVVLTGQTGVQDPSFFPNLTWINGRLNMGSRAGGMPTTVNTIELLTTVNGGASSTGQCFMTQISASSAGQIGP